MKKTTKALTVTVDDVLRWDTYWDDDKARKTMASKERWTAQDFADLYKSGEMSAREFLWVVLREELIPENTLDLLACDFAEMALMRERAAGREPHPDLWKAIEIKRAWVYGRASDQSLKESTLAARWVISEAKNRAEWKARAVAETVAGSTAQWAARDTAGAAICAAAWSVPEEMQDAAIDAVRTEQSNRIVEIIDSVRSGMGWPGQTANTKRRRPRKTRWRRRRIGTQ